MTNNKHYDVIIIGGSYAGLSAAMALGRSMRNVLILDSGLPCNRQTPFSHNFITQDGEKPGVIAAKAKQQVLAYETVTFHESLAVRGVQVSNHFEITTSTDEIFLAKKLIFATGIKDIMPDIKGFAACWGISIIHCPYCHGYEHRHQRTGIIANGQKAFHLVSMVSNLTGNITLLTNGTADFSEEQLDKLNNRNIKIIETEIAEVEHENGNVKHLLLQDGSKMPFDVVYGAIPFVQHADIPVALGCELTEHGHLKIDAMQRTTVPNIYACGDNSNMMRSVANAVSSGSMAGAVANGELVQAQF